MEKPRKKKVEKPQRMRVEKPQKKKVERPRKKKVEKPQKKKVEKPRKKKVEKPRKKKVEKPRKKKAVKPRKKKAERRPEPLSTVETKKAEKPTLKWVEPEAFRLPEDREPKAVVRLEPMGPFLYSHSSSEFWRSSDPGYNAKANHFKSSRNFSMRVEPSSLAPRVPPQKQNSPSTRTREHFVWSLSIPF